MSLPYIPGLMRQIDLLSRSPPVEAELGLPVGEPFLLGNLPGLGAGAEIKGLPGHRMPAGGIPTVSGREGRHFARYQNLPYHTWRTVDPRGYVYRIYQPVDYCENYEGVTPPANASFCAVGPRVVKLEGMVSHGYDLRRRWAREAELPPVYPASGKLF